MTQERGTPAGWTIIDDIRQNIQNFEPRTKGEEQLYAEGLDQVDTLSDARRMRLVAAEEGVPGVLWSVLVFGGIAAVSFTYLFGLESTWAHRLMVGTLAAVPRHFPLLPPPVAKGVEAVHGDDIPLVYAFCFLTGGEIPTDDVVADRPGGNAEGFRRNVGVDPAGTSPVVSAFLTPHAHTTPEGRVLRTVLRWGQRGERTSN
jgi:hypothetical protein